VSCGDTNFYFSNENTIFLTVIYLVDHFFENVDVPDSKRVVFQLLKYFNHSLKMVTQKYKIDAIWDTVFIKKYIFGLLILITKKLNSLSLQNI